MSTQRPTSLKLMINHCPKALDFYEADAPYERGHFAVGVTAHDVLHAVALTGDVSSAAQVRHMLMTTGRSGVDSEGPLPPQAVMEGSKLALRWISVKGITMGGEYEVGLAYLDDWTPVAYTDTSAAIRTRLDVLAVVEDVDDEWSSRGLLVADYKSSWAHLGNVLGLDSYGERGGPVALQQRIQAVAAQHYIRLQDLDVEFIRLRISNLRTLHDYDLDLWLSDPDDVALLEEWQLEIGELVEAANHKPRLANPGDRCIGCPYFSQCQGAISYWMELGYDSMSDLAQQLGVCEAFVSDAKKLLKKHLDAEAGPITVGDRELRWLEKVQRVPVADAATKLWELWLDGREVDATADSYVRGLLAVGKLGKTQVDAIARAIYPERADIQERRDLVQSLLVDKLVRRLGWAEVTS